MPKCRPNPDDASHRTPTGLQMPGNRPFAAGPGNVTAKYGRLHRDAAPLGGDSAEQDFDRHAALLDDCSMSRSANGIQRAMIVRRLQRYYGIQYVQRLIEHVSRRKPTPIKAKITTSGGRDKGAALIPP